MSVIVKTAKGKILLYSKGADQEMAGRILRDQENGERLKRTNKDLSEFSVEGNIFFWGG
jgi:magnesium-transporting ATPase (P-type)